MSKTIENARIRQEYLFSEMANLLGALASPVRLKIFHYLTQSPHSVEQLSEKLGQSVANTSMHLKKLQRENLLKTETRAQKRIYSLAQPQMKEFWEQILDFTAIHSPQDKISSEEIYGENLDWKKNVEETVKSVKAKKVTLLDVRPLDETDADDIFYKKHVLNVPMNEIKKGIKNLPKSKPVLIVCRGRLCIMANETTSALRQMGFDAYRLSFSWYQLSKKFTEV